MAVTVADLQIVVGADTKEAEQGLDNLSSKTQSFSKGDITAASAALLGFSGAVAGGFGFAIGTAADFEQQLSNIASVGGPDAAAAMNQIRAEALRLGADTSFSASEAAAAMEEMLKAGVSLEDVLGGATQAALDLSAATGYDVPSSAALISTAMNTMGIDAERAANVISQVTNAAAMDVRDFEYAFKYAGTAAAALGVPIEDLAATFGVLSDAGIRGEQAGTSMRNMLTSLAAPTAEQKALLDQLGISVYDANGNFRGLESVVGDLQGAWAGLTQEQKMQYAETLVGKEGMSAFLALMESGPGSINKMKESMAGVGTANEQAQARMDNLKGAIEQLKGAFESAMITVGTMFIPVIRTVAEFLTGLVQKFLALPAPIQGLIAGVVGAAGAIAGLAGALGMASQVAPTFAAGLKLVGNALRLLTVGSPVGAIMALAAVAIYAYQNFEPFRNIVNAVASKLVELGQKAASAISGFTQWASTSDTARYALEALGVTIGVVAAGFIAFKTVQTVVGVINAIRTAFVALNATMLANPFVAIGVAIAALAGAVYFAYRKFEPFRNVVNAIGSALLKVGQVILSAVIWPFKMLWQVLQPVASFLGGVLASAFGALWGVIKKVASAIGNLVGAGLGKLWKGLTKVASIVGGAVASGFSKLMTFLQPVFDLFGRIAGVVGGALSSGFNLLRSAVSAVASGFMSLASGALGTVVGWFTTLASIVGGALWSALQKVGSFIGGVLAAGFNVLSSAIGTVVGWVSQLVGWFMGLDSVQAIVNGIVSAFTNLKDAFTAITDLDFGAAFSMLAAALGNVLGIVKNLVVGIGQDLINAFTNIDWGSIGTTILNGIQTAIGMLGDFGSFLLDKGSQLINGLKSGAETAWTTFTGWIGGLDFLSLIGELGTTLLGKGSALINGLKSGAETAWTTFTGWIGGLDFTTLIGDLASTLVDKGTALINGLKSGAETAWGTVSTWFSGLPSKVLDFIGNVATTLLSKGRDLIDGLKKGAQNAWDLFTSWLGRRPSMVVRAIGSLATTLLQKGKDLLDGLKKGAEEAWETLTGWLGELDFLGSLPDFGEAVINKGKEFINKIKEGIETAWEELKSFLGGLNPLDHLPDVSMPDWVPFFGGGDDKKKDEKKDTPSTSVQTPVDIPQPTFDGMSWARTINDALIAGFNGLSGGSLAGAIENWFWRAIGQIGSHLSDDALQLARNFDTAVNTAFTGSMSGASLATAIQGWFTKAISQVQSKFNEPAMQIARALDTAINTAMTQGMSGQSLASSLQAWIAKATAAMNSGDAATGIGMAIARSIDTAVKNAIATGMSGNSLAASLQTWIAKATAAMNAGDGAQGVGLAIARSIDTATNTGLSALSGESLGSGISGWIGRAMTSVGETLTTLGTSFGTLVNGAFVSGLGQLSGDSLGSAMKSWIDRGFQQSKTAIQQFATTTLGDLTRWTADVQRQVQTAMTNLSSEISRGTSNARSVLQTFTSTTRSMISSWGGDLRSVVSSTMGEVRSRITTDANSARTAITTFASQSRSAMSGWSGDMRSTVSRTMNSVRSTISSAMSEITGTIRSQASSWASAVGSASGAMRSAGVSVGYAAGEGVYSGMMSALGMVRSAANALIAEVDRAMRAKARINSPSKMTMYVGQMIGQGLVVGMDDMIRDVSRMGSRLAAASLVQPSAVTVPTSAYATTPVHRAPQQVVIYQTNHYTVDVDDLEDLNEAVEFVNGLQTERELVFTS